MIEEEATKHIVPIERPGARIRFGLVQLRALRLEQGRAQHFGKPDPANAPLVGEPGFVERGESLDQIMPVEKMREGQLAAAEHPSQKPPAASRFVKMEHVRKLVSEKQLDRIGGVEELTLDRCVRECNDPVGGIRRRGPIEDIALIYDDQPDLASWNRSIRSRQKHMRRFGPGRGTPRVVFQADFEGQDEVGGLECPVLRERNTELGACIGRNEQTDHAAEDHGS